MLFYQTESMESTKAITYRVILIVFLAKLIFLGPGCSNTKERFEMGYQPRMEPPTDVYDPNNVKTVKGQIFDLDSFMFEEEIAVVNLNIKDNNNNYYFVQVAPNWYLNTKKFIFKDGETITVTGSLVNMFPEEEEEELEENEEEEGVSQILLAREIKREGQIITLRSKDGKPLWYRRGMLRGRQLYLQKIIDDKRLGRNLGGMVPRNTSTNINPRAIPQFP